MDRTRFAFSLFGKNNLFTIKNIFTPITNYWNMSSIHEVSFHFHSLFGCYLIPGMELIELALIPIDRVAGQIKGTNNLTNEEKTCCHPRK